VAKCEKNEQARRFYEQYGFRCRGETSTYSDPGVDVVMVKYTLNPVPSRAMREQ
jgi:hypothetical protein